VAIEQKQRVVLREYRLDEAGLAKFHVIDVLGFCDTVGVNRQIMRRSSKVRPLLQELVEGGTGDCCSFLYQYWEPSEGNLKEADAASRKALELDPELAEAHASRGLAFSLNRRYEEAQEEFEKAIRLNPNLFEAYNPKDPTTTDPNGFEASPDGANDPAFQRGTVSLHRIWTIFTRAQ
jgi:tetratricopeptide (TPR) repeat protein